MATSSTTDSRTNDSPTSDSPTNDSSGPDYSHSDQFDTDSASESDSDSSSPTLFDRLQTAAKVIWVAFLALVVVFTLIPVVALWLGAVPFDPPPTLPYFAFVGLALVGAAALIAGAIYDA